MKSLIIGLGNPIMGDDAIGCKCAEALQAEIRTSDLEGIEIEQFFRGGISLMERMIGYDRVLIIDSISGTGREPGTVIPLTLEEVPSYTVNSPHDASLKNAIDFGLTLGVHLPHQINILAVEIEPKYEFSEQLSKPVSNSIAQVLRMARDWGRLVEVRKIDIGIPHQ